MFILTVILAVFAYSEGAASLPKLPKIDERIVGGAPADIRDAPYIVAILIDMWGTADYQHWCGGSIISDVTIVTAAHCVVGSRPSNFRVRAGSNLWNSGGQLVEVSKIISHEEFNSLFENDVALMLLVTPLTFNENVSSISLPGLGLTVADGTDSLTAGWGALWESEGSTNILQKVTLPIVNQKACMEAYRDIDMVVTDSMICAGWMGEGGRDACSGDSGGPLVVGKVLIGITSWGRGCAMPQYPGVWTRVSSLRGWIDDTSIILKKDFCNGV